MKRPRSLLPAVLCVLIAHAWAPADSFSQGRAALPGAGSSGPEFLALCESTRQQARDACAQVIAGMMQIQVMIGEKRPDLRSFCPPRQMSPIQARNLFVYWAQTHGELITMEYTAAITTALKDRYPCADVLR